MSQQAAESRDRRASYNPSMRLLRGSALVVLMLLSVWPTGARAVDAVVFEVRELSVAGIPVEAASVRLDILDEQTTRLTVTARSATVAEPVGRLTDLSLVCEAPVIAEPRYACDRGKL